MSKKKDQAKKTHGAQAADEAAAPLYFVLKARHRAEREAYDKLWAQRFGLRIHRTLSWLHKAELASDDLDMRFIALWVGFNAAYAGDAGGQISGRSLLSEKDSFQGFLNKVCRLDDGRSISKTLLQLGSGSIRNLLDNEFLFQPFWEHIHGKAEGQDWKSRFSQEKLRLQQAVLKQDAAVALGFVFERFYTLRNQLLHGGATWGGELNRAQLRLATGLLMPLLVDMLTVMLNHPAEFDSPPFYPPVV
jgi:hypothetical protein